MSERGSKEWDTHLGDYVYPGDCMNGEPCCRSGSEVAWKEQEFDGQVCGLEEYEQGVNQLTLPGMNHGNEDYTTSTNDNKVDFTLVVYR